MAYLNANEKAKLKSFAKRNNLEAQGYEDLRSDLDTATTPVKKSVSQTAATTITLDPPAQGPAGVVVRVTGGAVGVGPYMVLDSGATPAAISTNPLGFCKLSDDGATLTFSGNVTTAVVSYIPRLA